MTENLLGSSGGNNAVMPVAGATAGVAAACGTMVVIGPGVEVGPGGSVRGRGTGGPAGPGGPPVPAGGPGGPGGPGAGKKTKTKHNIQECLEYYLANSYIYHYTVL